MPSCVRTCVLALAALGCHSPSTPTIASLPPGGHHVLFIGSSLTYVNDLPGTLAALAALVGDTIQAETVAFPNFALEDHAADGTALRVIGTGGWQYVVLQQGPSSVEANRQNLISWTKFFNQRIRAAGARTALFMVWPAVQNFDTFQRTVESYALAAQAVDGLLLPVGDAWRTAWAKDPTLSFYSADGLHPSVLGTYLGALVMYERITGKDAHGLPPRVLVAGVTFDVPKATIQLLQDAAHATNGRYPIR